MSHGQMTVVTSFRISYKLIHGFEYANIIFIIVTYIIAFLYLKNRGVNSFGTLLMSRLALVFLEKLNKFSLKN